MAAAQATTCPTRTHECREGSNESCVGRLVSVRRVLGQEVVLGHARLDRGADPARPFPATTPVVPVSASSKARETSKVPVRA